MFELLKMKKNETFCDLNPPKGCIPFKINKFIKLENIEEEIKELPFLRRNHSLKKLRISNKKFKITDKIAQEIKTKMINDFDFFGYSKEIPKNLIIKKFI